MKAIPSVYRDVTFRSRLEARWAALFDHYEIRWAYEPDAYDTPSGLYLPDFYLPGLHTFVEVKPGPDRFDEVAVRFVAGEEKAAFLILDSPVIACRSYPLLTTFNSKHDWTDMCWCMSAKYLGSRPHDIHQRFYVCTGSSDGTRTASGSCSACGDSRFATYAEDPHFTRIRSMRFERGYAI
jgi:hypothetical protein